MIFIKRKYIRYKHRLFGDDEWFDMVCDSLERKGL